MRYGNALAAWLTGMLLCAPVHTVRLAESSVTASNPAAEIQQIIALGRISELRWPDFRDVQASVSAVYSQIGYSPLWIANGALTAKGQSVLDTLRGSAAKGLDPEDYDAAKLAEWAGRIDVSHDTARGLAVFDIAITVNLMRYASALHQYPSGQAHGYGMDS
jgi:hypothetical protein